MVRFKPAGSRKVVPNKTRGVRASPKSSKKVVRSYGHKECNGGGQIGGRRLTRQIRREHWEKRELDKSIEELYRVAVEGHSRYTNK